MIAQAVAMKSIFLNRNFIYIDSRDTTFPPRERSF